MTTRRLVSQALRISFTHSELWWFTFIPTVFLLVVGALFIYGFMTPIMELFHAINAAALDTATIVKILNEQVADGMMFAVPLLIVFLAVSIIAKNALIKSIERITSGKSFTIQQGLAATRGYFGATVILLVTVVGMSMATHATDMLAATVSASHSVLTTINLVLEIAIIFGALFTLHYVLISHDPVLLALQHRIRQSRSRYAHSLGLFFMTLVVALLLLALAGAIVGIGYYMSVVLGVLNALLLMIALIPVNVFLTTLWTLFFLSSTKPNTSH